MTYLLESCSTITPNFVTDKEKSFDSSTPSQYDPYNSGFIEWTTKIVENKEVTTGVVITSNLMLRYNNLINSYRLQLKEDIKTELNVGDGLKPYTDKYQNTLFWIDAEHFSYLIKMNKWAKNNKPDDSLWMKIQSKLL